MSKPRPWQPEHPEDRVSAAEKGCTVLRSCPVADLTAGEKQLGYVTAESGTVEAQNMPPWDNNVSLRGDE